MIIEEKLRNSDYPKLLKMYYSEDPKYCFGCISACRGLANSNATQYQRDNQNHNNAKNTELLAHQINSQGFRFMEVTGYYNEEYIDNGNKTYRLVKESSFMVPTVERDRDKLIAVLTELGKVFKQDSVLIIDTDHKPSFIWTGPGEPPEWINDEKEVSFDQNSIEEMFTKVGTHKNGRRFQLVDIRIREYANNYYTKMLYKSPKILNYERMSESGYLESFEKEIEKIIR